MKEEKKRMEELQKQLDPQVSAFYGNRLNTVPDQLPSVEESRRIADLSFHDRVHREEIGTWEDREIVCADRRIPVRIFEPAGGEEKEKKPAVLYFHGGGFVIHNVRSHDDLCRRIANEGGCTVISVEYRLAPEHPWPACMEDGIEALDWVFRRADELGVDRNRIAVAGDSAGATISAVVSLINRDRRRRAKSEGREENAFPEIALQILCYGSFGSVAEDGTDLSRDSISIRQFGNGGFVLPVRSMEWFMEQYVPAGTDENDPYLNPARAKDLTDLPPALCLTAQCDPLRDDGEAFAKALSQAGNQVTLHRMKGLMHGFLLYWYRFDRAKEAIGMMGEAIRSL